MLPIARAIGVTRLADVGGLDRIGLPLFQAVRPRALSLTVSQGKGLTRDAARVAALVEAYELHCAERAAAGSFGTASAAEAEAWARLPPADLQPARFDPAAARGWMAAVDLLGRDSVRMPHGLVSMDCTVPPAPDVWPNTNGLAAGNDLIEAETAALCEVLERDAHARWIAASAATRQATALDPAGIDDRGGRWLLARVSRAGLRVGLWDLSDTHGLATLACTIVEPGPAASLMLPPAFGAACHPRREIALARAIGEAAQARAALIAGTRDDLGLDAYADPGEQRTRLANFTRDYGALPSRRWADVPDQACATIAEERALLLAACARARCGVVARVDLTPPGSPLAVVRIVVPGFGDHDRPSA